MKYTFRYFLHKITDNLNSIIIIIPLIFSVINIFYLTYFLLIILESKIDICKGILHAKIFLFSHLLAKDVTVVMSDINYNILYFM